MDLSESRYVALANTQAPFFVRKMNPQEGTGYMVCSSYHREDEFITAWAYMIHAQLCALFMNHDLLRFPPHEDSIHLAMQVESAIANGDLQII